METTATVLAETDKSKNLTERELMVTHTHVFRSLVNRFREKEKKPINYFKFVLDPVCFGTSIENMLFVFFMVEEGKMDISVCEEIGLAMIVPLCRKNKGGHEEKKVGRGGSELGFSPQKNIFFLHISSSYAKILGETNQPWEFPRSGSKALDGKRKKKKRERK